MKDSIKTVILPTPRKESRVVHGSDGPTGRMDRRVGSGRMTRGQDNSEGEMV